MLGACLFAVFYLVAWTAWFFLLTGDVGRFYVSDLIGPGASGALGEALLIQAFAMGTALLSMSILYLLIWLDRS